jgi:hypothetical protein
MEVEKEDLLYGKEYNIGHKYTGNYKGLRWGYILFENVRLDNVLFAPSMTFSPEVTFYEISETHRDNI